MAGSQKNKVKGTSQYLVSLNKCYKFCSLHLHIFTREHPHFLAREE